MTTATVITRTCYHCRKTQSDYSHIPYKCLECGSTMEVHYCVVCHDREVNPMIGGLEPKIVDNKVVSGNKSFCSRICYNVYFNSSLQFSSMESLKRIADSIHAKAS